MTGPQTSRPYGNRGRRDETTAAGPARLPARPASPNGGSGEPSLSELFGELSRETKTLISQEMQLARAELKQRTAGVGKNAAQIAIGGAVLYAGVLGLMFAAIYALSELVAPWLAAFIVGLVVAAIGGILLYTGYNALKELDLTPRRTVQSLQENAQWLKRELS